MSILKEIWYSVPIELIEFIVVALVMSLFIFISIIGMMGAWKEERDDQNEDK